MYRVSLATNVMGINWYIVQAALAAVWPEVFKETPLTGTVCSRYLGVIIFKEFPTYSPLLASHGKMRCAFIMMTSSNGNIFRVTGPLCGELTGPGDFPTQRPVTLSFDVFFDLRLNKRLSKQPWGWWFETPSWSLWRHCNDTLGSYSRPTIKTHKYPLW